MLNRAKNELALSEHILEISANHSLHSTFYHAVILHAYYCIFYGAKAYLAKNGVKTRPPNEHRSIYKELEQRTYSGTLDTELFRIYTELLIKADTLLGIFDMERKKRNAFTYYRLPDANKAPAEESVRHAILFFRHMERLTNS